MRRLWFLMNCVLLQPRKQLKKKSYVLLHRNPCMQWSQLRFREGIRRVFCSPMTVVGSSGPSPVCGLTGHALSLGRQGGHLGVFVA